MGTRGYPPHHHPYPDMSYRDDFYPRMMLRERRHPEEQSAAETTLYVSPSRILRTTSTERESQHSGSPSGVVDGVEVVLSRDDDGKSISKSPVIMRKRSSEDEREPGSNPASDIDDEDMMVSPLPFEGSALFGDNEEDATSLMDLPDNIMTLPISPCGPSDV